MLRSSHPGGSVPEAVSMLKTLPASIEPAQLLELQTAADNIHASDALIDYIQALLDFSRQSPQFVAGLSPRAGLALLHSAKAWALMAGRNHAVPEDVQAVLPQVVGHRLRSAADTHASPEMLTALLQGVAIP